MNEEPRPRRTSRDTNGRSNSEHVFLTSLRMIVHRWVVLQVGPGYTKNDLEKLIPVPASTYYQWLTLGYDTNFRLSTLLAIADTCQIDLAGALMNAASDLLSRKTTVVAEKPRRRRRGPIRRV